MLRPAGQAGGCELKATEFESRHPVLLQQLIIGTAWATYLFDRDDVVWRCIRSYPQRRPLEHLCFVVAALLVGARAALGTRARAFSPGPVSSAVTLPRLLGDGFFAVGLASLLPLSGSILLLSGESIRLLRLVPRDSLNRSQTAPPGWRRAFLSQALQWGLFLSLLVFSWTLVDRQADILIAASVVVAAFLNLPVWSRYPRRQEPSGLS